jgi:hypothetical protein
VSTVANAPLLAQDISGEEGLLAEGPVDKVLRTLEQAQAEFVETAEGKSYVESVQLHKEELQNLIGKNRRVATVWRRNGGPQLIQAFLRILHLRHEVFPAEINGKPLQECLTRIQGVLMRYSSPSLSADITRLATRIGDFAGLTYPQILSIVQTPRRD